MTGVSCDSLCVSYWIAGQSGWTRGVSNNQPSMSCSPKGASPSGLNILRALVERLLFAVNDVTSGCVVWSLVWLSAARSRRDFVITCFRRRYNPIDHESMLGGAARTHPRDFHPASRRPTPNAGLMLGQRRRRRPNNKPALGQRLVITAQNVAG